MNNQSSPTIEKVSYQNFSQINAASVRRVVVRNMRTLQESLYVVAMGDNPVISLVAGSPIVSSAVEMDITATNKSSGEIDQFKWRLYEFGPPALVLARLMKAGQSIWPK